MRTVSAVVLWVVLTACGAVADDTAIKQLQEKRKSAPPRPSDAVVCPPGEIRVVIERGTGLQGGQPGKADQVTCLPPNQLPYMRR